MKKLLLTAVLALACVGMSAQDGLKGTWFVGGQAAFSNSKTATSKTNSYTILPIAGTFITPSVAVGAGIGYIGGKEKAKEGGAVQSKTSTFVVKPLVRKYWNVSGGLFFFGQAALPLLFGSTEKATSDTKKSSQSFSLELSPGFDYVVNSWITIETSFTILNMGYDRSKPKGGKADTSFGFNANPFNSVADRKVGDLQVGVKFLF